MIDEGDLVESVENKNRRYAVREVLSPPPKDGHTLVLMEVVDMGSHTSFFPFGRWKPEDVRVIERGRWVSRLNYWRMRDGRTSPT